MRKRNTQSEAGGILRPQFFEKSSPEQQGKEWGFPDFLIRKYEKLIDKYRSFCTDF